MSEFYTIKSGAESLYKEKGSKFISVAVPVTSEEEIQHQLDVLRKRFHDARHHCYAWVLGMEHQRWRANDDGEPNHSAGDPILGQIRSHELTNTLVVVIRYFGGTKLGVGGLIAAYKVAADSALDKCRKMIIFEQVVVKLFFPYEVLSLVERLVQVYEIAVDVRDFQVSCVLSGSLKKDLQEKFQEEIESIHQVKLEISRPDSFSS